MPKKPSSAEKLVELGDEILKHAKQISHENEERLRQTLSDTEQQAALSTDGTEESPPTTQTPEEG